ncbi:TetR family transcriptional regulator [Kitasatospora sp. MMS16-BH015]|uniref:TetR/AcrR family transcriptional regulator n=1 Tax=Kitasatospora sp. MMS16-BH015 TaxID=2018025 RepID=UPI000CA0AA6A|nr:TetR/AcrR family transcriptional regulator [Kitasatospora sp. MMS16-BH015]AUG80640.1 TetR family transcriptional regulator [Kitasatospora sp. MMS16-BH015]
MSDRVVPEPQRRRRKPTKTGTVLSEELIVETALRLLAQHGSEALTVRRLGLALGADPSALYRYFRSADDLLLAVADELIGRAQCGWEPTGDWQADLRAIGLRIHACYRTHPQAARLAGYRTTGRAHEMAAVENILGLLRRAGFPDAEAVRLYHAFVDQGLGFAILDAAADALPDAAREADESVWQERYAHLSARSHPNIAATAGLLTVEMRFSGYPLALDLLIASAADRLAAIQAAGRAAGQAAGQVAGQALGQVAGQAVGQAGGQGRGAR